MHALISLKKAFINFKPAAVIRTSALILLSFAALSCNNNKNNEGGNVNGDSAEQARILPEGTLARADSMSENLYRLYLVNTTANPELKDLLDSLKGHEKVVFQFTHDKAGFLLLRAWAGKPGNKKFDLGKEVLLKKTPENIIDTTLHNVDVDLGGVELDKKSVKALRDKINTSQHNDPNYNYILFIPKIVSDNKIENNGNANLKHVVYTIAGSPSLNKDKDALVPNRITDANPSPPREAF
jgi:hypothetical protein